MTCSSAEALFEAYLDNRQLPAQRVRLLSHLNRCGRCKGVLEELRVVDALLSAPREVALPENFTFATMAEVRSLPRPQGSSSPVFAYLASYLVAAWALIGIGFLFAWPALHAFGAIALEVSGQAVHALGALEHAGARVVGDFVSLGTVVGVAIALDVFVAFALVVVFTVVRPRLGERLRW